MGMRAPVLARIRGGSPALAWVLLLRGGARPLLSHESVRYQDESYHGRDIRVRMLAGVGGETIPAREMCVFPKKFRSHFYSHRTQ